jgi:hypothetical protein
MLNFTVDSERRGFPLPEKAIVARARANAKPSLAPALPDKGLLGECWGCFENAHETTHETARELPAALAGELRGDRSKEASLICGTYG